MTQSEKINTICLEIANPKGAYQDYLKKIPTQYRDDLYQEVLLILLEKPTKLIQAWESKWLRYYFVNICQKQFYSGTSPFYKKYKSQRVEYAENIHTDELDDTDIEWKQHQETKWELIRTAKKQVKLTWLENHVATMYWDEDMSMAKIAERTGTSTGYIFNVIHKILDYYRNAISEMVA